MKPGWRVFAGAAAAVVVWTLGLCAWALVSRGGPTLDLGPTIALEAPTEPEGVSPAPLPSADTSASVPDDVPAAPDVPLPTETAPAPPVAPQAAPTTGATSTTRTAPAAPPAQTAETAPVEAAPPETVAVEAAPPETVAVEPAPAPAPPSTPTRTDGWPAPGRPAPGQPSESVGSLEPGTQWGGSTPSHDGDKGSPGPRQGCDDDRHRWDRTWHEHDSTDDRR
ncbi:hypothetical protein [Sanguibacter sp. 25GB23B1]|uniref:hypothetical protein n=1 Tax=unclassified Sanguibacter TaxID=2645534 RepID=UPI0032AEBCA5